MAFILIKVSVCLDYSLSYHPRCFVFCFILSFFKFSIAVFCIYTVRFLCKSTYFDYISTFLIPCSLCFISYHNLLCSVCSIIEEIYIYSNAYLKFYDV